MRQAALYELTAACCVTETESVATLTTLLATGTLDVLHVVRDIARDEVRHAQMGWAHLERECAVVDIGFLSRALPQMLAGAAGDDLFDPASDPALDEPALTSYGVVPMSLKRTVFVQIVEEIVCPGFLRVGLDDGPARAWLRRAQERLQHVASP